MSPASASPSSMVIPGSAWREASSARLCKRLSSSERVSAEAAQRRAAAQPVRHAHRDGTPLPGALGCSPPQDRNAERGRIDCGVGSE
eukprot:9929449-Alexandrium_andersonii.AAC.1